MKKTVKMFVFMLMLFIFGTLSVKADYTIDFSNSDNRQVVENDLFSIKTHYKINTNNQNVYCYQTYVDYGYTEGITQTFVFDNCSTITTNAAQLSYIFANGYGGSNEYSTGGTKFDDYFATQLAVWYFGDRTLYSPHTSDFLNDFEKDSSGKLTGKYNGSNNDTTKVVANLINDANDSVSATSSISFEINNTKLNINSNREYYISDPIKINGSWIKKDIKISISGATGVFVTNDINSTSGSTNFTVGDTIYVKVPASSVNSDISIKLSASAKSKKGNGKVTMCKNTDIPSAQQMVNYINGTPETVNKDLTLTATPAKVVVNISKQDIAGSKEVKGATLVIKQGNTQIAECISDGKVKQINLEPGTYTLEETSAPDGYKLSTEKITFKVNSDNTITINNKKVDKVLMKNEPYYVNISKLGIDNKILPGATLKITDKEGKLEKDLDGKSLTWITTTKEERFHLAPGTYVLTEIEAPKGYELSDKELEFTVTEDGKILFEKQEAEDNLIVFKNTPEAEQKPTGSAILYIMFVGLVTAISVTIFVLKKYN